MMQRSSLNPFDCRRHGAFTLLEMLVTITILAIGAAMIMPMFSNDERLRVLAASSIVASDIELAQVMTIAIPSAPTVVRFDAAAKLYWLAYAYDPNTPLYRTDTGEPYVVEFGIGRASSAAGVTFTVAQMTNNTIEFDSSGALVDFTTTPMIQFASGDSAITLSISPMTGTIVEFDGTIEQLLTK